MGGLESVSLLCAWSKAWSRRPLSRAGEHVRLECEAADPRRWKPRNIFEHRIPGFWGDLHGSLDIGCAYMYIYFYRGIISLASYDIDDVDSDSIGLNYYHSDNPMIKLYQLVNFSARFSGFHPITV
eukprot:1392001-Amorphochlora_amoeboformis.AAC.1